MFNQLPHDLNAKTYREEVVRRANHERLVQEAAAANHASRAFYAPFLALLGHIIASLGVWLEGRYSTRSHQHNVPGFGQTTG